MKRPRQHQIDAEAQTILLSHIPSSWVVNEQKKDYAKDFLVEICKREHLTGSGFFIQLKGSDKIECKNGCVRFPLETKYAEYYRDKLKEVPIFLVVVNVKKRTGWWIFLQEYLSGNTNWRRQKTSTIKIPAKNQLSNSDALENAVVKAQQWLLRRHPEALPDAIQSQCDRISEIDPRFCVRRLTIENGVLGTQIYVNEEVVVSAVFNHAGVGKWRDVVERGVSRVFEQPGEITLRGSPLFEMAGKFELSMARNVPKIVVYLLDSFGHEVVRLPEMDGDLRHDTGEVICEGQLLGSPWSVRVNAYAAGETVRFHNGYNPEKWNGQLLTELRYFDLIRSYFSELKSPNKVVVEIWRDDNLVGSITTEDHALQGGSQCDMIREVINLIWKARQLARHFRVQPVFKLDQLLRDGSGIEMCYAMTFDGKWTDPTPRPDFKYVCEIDETEIARTFPEGLPCTVRNVGVETNLSFELFDKDFDIGRVAIEFNEITISIEKATPTGAPLQILMAGTKHTLIRHRRLENKESAAGVSKKE